MPDAQQFYTDENGVHYSRYGNDTPWRQISPSRPGFSQSVPTYHFPRTDFGPLPGVNTAPSWNLPPPASIDPASLPLPDDTDEDFPPAHLLLPRIARPASKVAGSRRADPDPKGKGKQVVRNTSGPKSSTKRKAVASADAPEPKKPKGRVAGTANYTPDDIWGLLAILSERLPIGGKAWNNCTDEFNAWAEENGRPVRTAKSLEAKYKQLVKTTKPTGDAEMPEYVYQAHEIEDAINEKAGTRDLDDDEIADDVHEISSEDGDEDNNDSHGMPKAPPSAPKKLPVIKKEQPDSTGPVARRAASDRITQPSHLSRHPRNAGSHLLSTLSEALDPSAMAARQEERAARTLQTSQLFSVTAQLREAQNLVETLRTRLADSDRERNAAERRADRAELMVMFSGNQGPPSAPPSLHPPRWANVPSATRTPSRPVRQDVFYGDGGHCVRWLGPDDSPRQYLDSPRTRVFSRYTPERVNFSSREAQSTPSRLTQHRYSPSPMPRPRQQHSHDGQSASRRHYSPEQAATLDHSDSHHRSQSVTHNNPYSEPVASSSRHPDCIPEALTSDYSNDRHFASFNKE